MRSKTHLNHRNKAFTASTLAAHLRQERALISVQDGARLPLLSVYIQTDFSNICHATVAQFTSPSFFINFLFPTLEHLWEFSNNCC